MSKQIEVEEAGRRCGLSVCHHNPGDGAKVRVFEGLGKDYFDSHCIFATNSSGAWSKAAVFIEGYEAALNRPRASSMEERLSLVAAKADKSKYAADPGPVTAFGNP